MSLRRLSLTLALSALVPACNPYHLDGEFYAGPIDPVNFPIKGRSVCDCTSAAPAKGDPLNSNCAPITDGASDAETPDAICRPYQGAGFTYQTTQGTLFAATAWVGGQKVGYYAFPAPTGSLLDIYNDVDPPNVVPPSSSAIRSSRPEAYVFDNALEADSANCNAPANYVFDAQRDYIRFDHQANVFQQKVATAGYGAAALPEDDIRSANAIVDSTTGDLLEGADLFGALGKSGALKGTYFPAYAEVAVASNGEDCQGLKSAEGIVTSAKVNLDKDDKVKGSTDANLFATGKRSGRYLAWAAIDPATDVRFPNFNASYADASTMSKTGEHAFPYTIYDAGAVDPNTLLGPQRWGYFNHFLVAYIDGGLIPNTVVPPAMPAANGVSTTTVNAIPQTLYVPTIANVPTVVGADSDMNPIYGLQPNDPTMSAVPVGIGYDVLQAKRVPGSDTPGEGGYSPLCKIVRYTNPDENTIAKSEAEVMTINNGATLTSEGFIYCLQLAGQ